MMKKKHILFIFRTLGTGGSQKIQSFVANSCLKAGYDVTILSMSKDKCTLNIDSNIHIYTLNYDEIITKNKNRITRLLHKIKYLIKFRRECKKINPDLICVFLIDVVRLTLMALKGISFPIIASERADPGQFSQKKIRQYNRALNNCAGVVFQLAGAAQFYKINRNVIQEIIPNPSILKNRYDVSYSKNDNEPFIFGAGRLTKQKRFDILINAYHMIRSVHPEYRLKIYGDGIEENVLKDQVDKMRLVRHIDFMGTVENIFQDINEKSIFILTSDYEGIPNVLSEALIFGIPCISTDCSPGGARLLLNNGECGDIVERGNHKQVAETAIKYIENWEYAKEKALNGQRYMDKFAPGVIANKWLELFRRILIDEQQK